MEFETFDPANSTLPEVSVMADIKSRKGTHSKEYSRHRIVGGV
jgi:hypothetical protein